MNKYSEISPSRASLVTQHLDFSVFGTSIIEFGAASGETLKELQTKYDCTVESFDLFPVNLDFCNSSYFNLDDLNFDPIKSNLKKSDIILFLDVLEHVKEPRKIVEDLLTINSDLTIVVISPNFASIRMLSAWLNGFLPEHSSGFYDSTHLKWLSPKWFAHNLCKNTYNMKFFHIFSNKRHVRALQYMFPRRLCSQFGAVINVK